MEVDTGFLTYNGFLVPSNILIQKLGKKYSTFLQRLTITHVQKIGQPKVAKMYSAVTFNGIPCLALPRTTMSLLLNSGMIDEVKIYWNDPVRINAKLYIELYENQSIVVNYLMKHIYTQERINAGTASCILDLRAGFGKSFIAGALIPSIGMRTLYIVPKCPLAVQAEKDLRTCLIDTDSNDVDENTNDINNKVNTNNINDTNNTTVQIHTMIGRFEDPNLAFQDITIIVINSALMQSDEFFAKYSFIVLDEVHMYCSDKRRNIFKKCCNHAMLGLSATLNDRNDGFDPIAHKELAFADDDNKPLYDKNNNGMIPNGIINAEFIPGFTYDNVEFKCYAKLIQYRGPPEYTKNLTHESTGNIFTHYMHNQFIADPYRLKLAVDELCALYDWRGPEGQCHNIYVFAEELDILRIAKDTFMLELMRRNRVDIANQIIVEDEANNVNTANANTANANSNKISSMFTGGLSSDEILAITKSSRVLFSTYGYAGTGVSILKMTAMLLLTPRRAGFKQTFARIMRRGSDLSIPRVVIDIIDKNTALQYQFGSRKNAYDLYGFKFENIKIEYTAINLFMNNIL